MGFAPALSPAISAESFSRKKLRLATLRTEAQERLQQVFPLIGVYCTAE